MERVCLRILVVTCTAGLLAACSTTTTIAALPAGATLDVKTSSQTTVPRSERYEVTTFGNYEFRGGAPGAEPFYGLLPLRFRGDYLALDILFLAPLAFKNLRSVYPYYEFDLESRVVRYRAK